MAFIGTNNIIQSQTISSNVLTTISSSGGPHEATTSYRGTITPKLSDSNIYLQWACPVNEQGGGRNVIYSAGFQRSTDQSSWTNVCRGQSAGSRDQHTAAFRPYGYDGNDPQMLHVTGLDSPGTTSTLYYRLVFYFDDGTPNMYFNYSQANYSSWPWTGRMVFSLTEIEA